VRHPLAVDVVRDAHLDGLERVEDVELGEEDLGEAVEPHRLAQHHRVEPAGAAAALRVDAVLVAPVDEPSPTSSVSSVGNGPEPTA
jgi:hypothetical protein